MFYSVARCVRNGSGQSIRIALGVSTLHGAVRRSGQGTRAWVPSVTSGVLPLRLLSGSVSVRALSISGASSPGRTAHQQETDPDEGEEGGFGAMSGTLSSRISYKKSSPYLESLRFQEDEDEDRGEAKSVVRRRKRVNNSYWYFLQCKKLIKENKLQEALDLFSEDMLQGERLQPEEFNYSVLIGGCGRAGHLKKAFKLYNDMKKRGLEPSDATYTALFNACAECLSKQAGLNQALKLEQELRRKNYRLSTITYHALLKVHAVANHLQACLHTLREMLENGHVATQETFHYLLMGCVKDKDIGFRLALQYGVRKLKPDLKVLTLLADTMEPSQHAFSLLLRTAKQHQVKLDVAFFNSVIRRAAKAGDMEMAQAVLSAMRQRHVSVDSQTFGCLALGCVQEKNALQLISNMEVLLGLRPNVHIFSALIGRAARRLDYVYLKKLLMLMKEKEVWPNEVIIKQLEFAAQYPPNYDQYKRRNNYLVHIDGFRGYYQHWLRSVPAQTVEQTQTEAVQMIEEGADGLSETQRNQRAAARRYHSKKGKSTSSSAQSAL
ncbi:hypothetical protein WMY93_031127 [Mugilogobius chulae]|uniref:Pentatricopeptide repeat domain 1 n=1 Tax=Mugilogobius chulae TaxID=88201 RepID=A0AAW0MJ38_9GOBI